MANLHLRKNPWLNPCDEDWLQNKST
jgi:hypothetical protein